MTIRTPPTSSLDRWGALLIVFGGWFVAFLALTIAWLLAPDAHANGRCSGIGFGCTPTPKDSLALGGVIVGIPASIVWFIVGLISASLLRRIKSLRWWAVGLISLGLCVLSSLLILVAVFLL